MITTPVEEDKEFKFGYLLRKVEGVWYITWNGTSAYWYFAKNYTTDSNVKDIVENLNLEEEEKGYDGNVTEFLSAFLKDSYACHNCHAIIPKKYINKIDNGYACPLCNNISNFPFTKAVNNPVVLEEPVQEKKKAIVSKEPKEQESEQEKPLMQQKQYLEQKLKYCSCGHLLNKYNDCEKCDIDYITLVENTIYYDNDANIYVKGRDLSISTNFDVLVPWNIASYPKISRKEYEAYYFQAALTIDCRLALQGWYKKLVAAYYVEGPSGVFNKGFYIDTTEQGKQKSFFIPYKLKGIFDLSHSEYDKSLETYRKKLVIPEVYRDKMV